MTGVPRSIAEHRLNIQEGYSPVRQKKRGQAPERNKHDGTWRMCVDFKDLNNACPKDCYPLPEIDWKVESLCGYPFKCFLDAYKGYHQIKMAKEDEEKTAFITSQGIFCYSKMSFGLKNVGSTYQRLVDKAFQRQIGRNIEVYVDDLVIKSHTEEEIIRDITETFKILRQINMKLNPKKCTFGMQEGMFLVRLKERFSIETEAEKLQADEETYCRARPTLVATKSCGRIEEKYINEKKFLTKVEEEATREMTPICGTWQRNPSGDKKKPDWYVVKAGQFRDNPFKDWCEKLCIRQCFASVKHPQANGLVERANRSLGEGIKARLDERSKEWIENSQHCPMGPTIQ
ncbi:reverse transcriptase domain-containing protein [Tanacetum coccineum]